MVYITRANKSQLERLASSPGLYAPYVEERRAAFVDILSDVAYTFLCKPFTF